MINILSYLERSIIILFLAFFGLLSCEELAQEMDSKLTDTVSVFDTVSVSDTISILDTIFFVDSMGYEIVGNWEGVTFIEQNDTIDHTNPDSSWVKLSLTIPDVIKPLHEFYYRTWEYGDTDTFITRGVYSIIGDTMYVYSLWNNEDGGSEDGEFDLLRLGFDLDSSNDTITFSENYTDEDSDSVYLNTYKFKRL